MSDHAETTRGTPTVEELRDALAFAVGRMRVGRFRHAPQVVAARAKLAWLHANIARLVAEEDWIESLDATRTDPEAGP